MQTSLFTLFTDARVAQSFNALCGCTNTRHDKSTFRRYPKQAPDSRAYEARSQLSSSLAGRRGSTRPSRAPLTATRNRDPSPSMAQPPPTHLDSQCYDVELESEILYEVRWHLLWGWRLRVLPSRQLAPVSVHVGESDLRQAQHSDSRDKPKRIRLVLILLEDFPRVIGSRCFRAR